MGEPVKKPSLGVGRFAGLNREYSVEYSIGSAGGVAYGSAGLGVNGSNMARVDGTRLLPLARVGATGQTVQNLQVARVGYHGLRSRRCLRQ
jgi:hypothetical protein